MSLHTLLATAPEEQDFNPLADLSRDEAEPGKVPPAAAAGGRGGLQAAVPTVDVLLAGLAGLPAEPRALLPRGGSSCPKGADGTPAGPCFCRLLSSRSGVSSSSAAGASTAAAGRFKHAGPASVAAACSVGGSLRSPRLSPAARCAGAPVSGSCCTGCSCCCSCCCAGDGGSCCCCCWASTMDWQLPGSGVLLGLLLTGLLLPLLLP